MSVSLLPNSTVAASEHIPSFVREWVKIASRKQVEVTINDMKFTGMLWNFNLTDNVYDTIILEAMTAMGITGNDILKYERQTKEMLELMGYLKGDINRLFGDLITLAGLVVTGKAGAVVSGIDALYNIINSNFGYAAASGAGGVGSAAGSGSNPSAGGKAAGKVSTGLNWVMGGLKVHQRWQRDSKKFGQMADGLNATRQLNDLYNLTQSKLAAWCDRNAQHNAIYFDGTQPRKKTFMLYGVECTETWRFNMSLDYKRKANPHPNIQDGFLEGVYEGEYTITIEYDLSKFAEKLPELMRMPGWIDSYSNMPGWERAMQPGINNIALSNPGTSSGKRTLAGKATARIQYDNGTVQPTQNSDKKDSVPNITLSTTHTGSNGGRYDIDFVIYANEDGIFQDIAKWRLTESAGNFTDFPTGGLALVKHPWEGDVWKRGDNAGKGWTLRLLNR